jgi:2-polyprenyl-6-methoxyphenol hydroxylase-like FAD-dependent oxidoreductase
LSVARFDRAVVMGGSMAGLLAARVLAGHAREVVVLERDAFPDAIAHRKGTPHARHTHVLLGAGRRTLDRLFPGFTDELCAAGAVLGDALGEVRRFLGGGYHALAPSDVRTLYASRPMIEAHVRARVRALPNVTLRGEAPVRGLAWSADGARVTGVVLDGDGSTLDADIVLDATGRGSRAVAWLAERGYEAPVEERVECGGAYATRRFRASPGLLDGLKAVIVPPAPGRLRGAVLAAQEHGTWTLSLMAMGGERPPAEPATFAAFADGLPAPEIGTLVREAEPLDEIVTATFPTNVRRRFDRLARFPERFVVLGDAICCFNPMYGQGMSVAALEATALEETLAEPGDAALGPRYFRRAAPALEAPWLLAAGNDLRLTRPDAPVSRKTRFLRWYMDRLHVAARTDVTVARAFLMVAGLVAPPASLLRPATARRVLLRFG